ncbi:MAG: Glycosyltransferase, GT2 family [Parcubacteria group bacterium Athens0714_16]|nr:MAG: Glycosyltransferase, GT2 family [Parcubacteria group bacterium Athens0714_16]
MIDIIITTYKTDDYLDRLLESLLPNKLINKIIVSDGEEKEIEVSKNIFKDTNVIRLSDNKRKYFSENCNYGFQYVTSEYLVLINADTKVSDPNWLDILLKTQNENSDYGILSPWGVFYDEPKLTNKTEVEEQNHIGAFCWFMKSELFRKLNGLRIDGDYIHWNSDFEFCDRVYKEGLKIGWAPTTIAHKGGGSGQPTDIKRF